MQLPRKYDVWLRDVIVVALGLTVPAMVSGRAVLQGLAAAALVACIVLGTLAPRFLAPAAGVLRNRFALAVAAAFVGMALSIPGSLEPVRSFEAWARTLAFIGGCTLFWSVLTADPAAGRRTHAVLVWGMFASAGIIVLAQLGVTLPLQILRNEWINISLAWALLKPKAYAAAAACTLPVLVWTLWSRRGPLQWAAGAATLFIAVIIAGAGNKSAMAGILAALLVTSLVLSVRLGRKWVAAWLLWAAIVSGVTLTAVYRMPDAAPSNPVWTWMPAHLVDTHRQQIWHFTLQKVAEKPVTGWGINVIDRAPGAHEKPPGYSVEYIPSHPHNWVLEILAETGLFGLLPVIAALAWFLIGRIRRYLSGGAGRDLALIGVFCVFWGSSLFNFSIWSSWWLITFFLLTAVISAAGDPPEKAYRGDR